MFLLSEDGHTFVIEVGDKYVELAKMSLAAPALAPGTLFMAHADALVPDRIAELKFRATRGRYL